MSGTRVTIPDPRGKKSRPTMDSSTDDFPELCEPTTTICGKSTDGSANPIVENTSWSLRYAATINGGTRGRFDGPLKRVEGHCPPQVV
eukprot:m.397231 g.397231  ORF g.397231 m.397231 type:complete len:88 (-) comp16772_c3_seq52:1504-1767(-)